MLKNKLIVVCMSFLMLFSCAYANDYVHPMVTIGERMTSSIYKDNTRIETYSSPRPITFTTPYMSIEGIPTFRGNYYRDSPSFGTTQITSNTLERIWEFKTGTSSWGGGAGWTGQPVVMNWPYDIRQMMTIYPEFKAKEEFVEVIYGSLAGYVYFLDLETGKPSRPPIKVGNPIKGSVSVDPRGLPLLFVGEGVPENGSIGLNIYSLIDGSRLYRINGIDPTASRGWGAFDSAALVDPETDTLIQAGENGLLYLVKLNSSFNRQTPKISISPEIYKYKYQIKGEKKYGIENSPAIYKNLIYFADNSGHIQCVDLTTLTPVWLINSGDDTDATITLSIENDVPYVYTGNEIDRQGTSGICTLRKINGLTGQIVWENKYPCKSIIGDKAVNGGLLATSVIGKESIDNLVIFSIARYETMNAGLMVALDKTTGKTVWSKPIKHYMWSSPLAFYSEDGTAYLIQCDSVGNMFLLDGETGNTLHSINLGSNIESSPIFYKDYIVVAPRGNKIVGIKVK